MTPAATAPLVSVIVPAYNAERTLADALNSVQAQTFRDFELIVIDDGSDDDTFTIAQRYAAQDSRFQLIHQDNKGVSTARNVGLLCARGEWISFLDADDLLAEDYLDGLVRGAENHFDIVYCGAVEFRGESGEIKELNHERCIPVRGAAIKTIAECTLDYQAHGFEGCCNQILGYVWAKLYRKSAIESIRFDPQIGMREDALFNIEVLQQCHAVKIISENGYIYRIRDCSSSSMFHDNYGAEVEQFLYACHKVWTRWNLSPLTFDKAVLTSYMSWLKLNVLHKSAPYSISKQNRLIQTSFNNKLWATSFEHVSSQDLDVPYSLLRRAFLARSVYAIRLIKFFNDIKNAI